MLSVVLLRLARKPALLVRCCVLTGTKDLADIGTERPCATPPPELTIVGDGTTLIPFHFCCSVAFPGLTIQLWRIAERVYFCPLSPICNSHFLA